MLIGIQQILFFYCLDMLVCIFQSALPKDAINHFDIHFPLPYLPIHSKTWIAELFELSGKKFPVIQKNLKMIQRFKRLLVTLEFCFFLIDIENEKQTYGDDIF